MNAEVAKLEALLATVQRNRLSARGPSGAAAEHESWADETGGLSEDLHPPFSQSSFDESLPEVEADPTEDRSLDLATFPPPVDDLPVGGLAEVEPVFDEPHRAVPRLVDPAEEAFVSPFDAPRSVSQEAPQVQSADSLFPEPPSANIRATRPHVDDGIVRTPMVLAEPQRASGPVAIVVGTLSVSPGTFGELVRRSLALRVR